MTHVYRLTITAYPAGSEQTGWQPEDWADICDENGWGEYDSNGEREIPWPGWKGRRLWFSPAAAGKRKAFLERCGATVEIQRSNPVTWPAAEPGEADRHTLITGGEPG